MIEDASRNRRLRIAFVVHDYNRHTGQGRYVAELATRFKLDHDVHVFANTFEDRDPTGLVYHHIPAWRANALTSILSFVPSATLLVRGRFDVVHAQGLCGLRHNLATAHFCQPAWNEALARSAGGLTWRQALTRALVTPLERFALAKRSTRRVIAISESVRTDLARYFGRRDGIRVVYHGIDRTTFHPKHRPDWRDRLRAEWHVGPEECLALFVGGLWKGAAAAIHATARVPGLRLVLVSGSDPEPHRATARAAGVADRVVFAPFAKEVGPLFAAADLFLFPTLYEPYGMVISEAMASGVPVVTSRSAGAAELIDHGRTGWLVEDPWDPDAIAEGLRTLVADPARREQMGAAGRTAIEPYTWDRAAEETMAVYRDLLSENPR